MTPRTNVALVLAQWLEGAGYPDRAEAWRRAAGVGIGQVHLALKGYDLKPREGTNPMVQAMDEAGSAVHVLCNDGRGRVARWRLEGELLAVPDGWVASLAAAHKVEITIIDGRGATATPR